MLDKFRSLPRKQIMIQLCSKIIALEAVNINSIFNSKIAWIFDPVSFEWQQTQLDSDNLDWSRISNTDGISEIIGVAISQLQTSCQCKQSALIFLQIFRGFQASIIKQTMYEVRCVNQTAIESYALINVNSNIPPISRFQPPLFCCFLIAK